MYKVDVRVDGKEAAAIDRRRIQEYQRQSRIFNAKQRLIGVRVCRYWSNASVLSSKFSCIQFFSSIPSSSFILIH